MQEPGARVRGELPQQAGDDWPSGGRPELVQRALVLLRGLHHARFRRQKRVELRRAIAGDDGESLEAEWTEAGLERGHQVLGPPKRLRIVDEERPGALVDADNGDGVAALLAVPAQDEGDARADQACRRFRRYREEANVKGAGPQPVRRRPFSSTAKRDLRRHFFRRDCHTAGGQGGGDAGGDTFLVPLDGACERKPDAFAARVRAQVREKVAMERGARPGAPPFHSRIVVAQLGDVESYASEPHLRFTIRERSDPGQPVRQGFRPRQRPPPICAAQCFRERALVPARADNQVARLAMLGRRVQPRRRLGGATEVQEARAQACGRERRARIDFPRTRRRPKGLVPPVCHCVNGRFATEHPRVVRLDRMCAREAVVRAVKDAQRRPAKRVGREPGGAQFPIVAADIRVLVEVPQVIQDAPARGSQIAGEESHPQVARVPLECFSKQPSGQARSTETHRQPAGHDQFVDR